MSDALISNDEKEELTSGGGADGGEKRLLAAEVVGHEAENSGQRPFLILTSAQLGNDIAADAWEGKDEN